MKCRIYVCPKYQNNLITQYSSILLNFRIVPHSLKIASSSPSVLRVIMFYLSLSTSNPFFDSFSS